MSDPLPDPIIREHDGFLIVRDDMLPGGTKRRAMHVLFNENDNEYVYCSPVQGYAQVALAYAARDFGVKATIFCAARKEYAPLTQEAIRAGAKIIQVPMGFLSNVTAKAKVYCAETGAHLLPFGLDDPMFINTLASVAKRLPITPKEVWSITSSGVLTRAMQMAWPSATFYGVRVGAEPDAGKATVFVAPERFEQNAKFPPPFPSSSHYDAKMWRFVKEHGSSGALIWNVGA